jgi:hypothetical protein
LHHVDALFYVPEPCCAEHPTTRVFRPNWLLQTFAPQEYFAEHEVWPLREYEFAGRKYMGPRQAWPFLARAYPGFDRAGRLHWPHSWSPAQIPHLSICGLIAAGFVPDYPLTRTEKERLKLERPTPEPSPSPHGAGSGVWEPPSLLDCAPLPAKPLVVA